MATYKYIIDVEAKLPNGEFVRGPITTCDDKSYFFVNKFSSLDFYLEMKKGENGWYQSCGPEIQHPQSMVDELGLNIDKFLIENPKLNKTDLS
ncbi:hypothetical protein [Pedobacter terrae]|uniref:hypothetical protein n=1 Tax=Pedobacter terrae TaxID=405671 RepID=UPI002FF46A6D